MDKKGEDNAAGPKKKPLRSATRKRLQVGDESLVERAALDAALAALRANPYQNDTTLFGAHTALCTALDQLSRLFSPCSAPAKMANARCFVKCEGAMELLLDLVDDKYSYHVVSRAIRCLWGLSATEEISLVIIELGALSIIVEKLRSATNEHVISSALGFLWCYLEFPSVVGQATAWGVPATLAKLLDNIEPDDLAFVGCLQSLSFDQKSRHELATGDLPQRLIAKMPCDEPIVQYTSVIALALLTLDSEHEEKLLGLGVMDHITQYLDTAPEDIAAFNDEARMLWKFIRPFSALMASRHAPVRRLCGLIYAALALTSAHEPLFKKENLVGELLAVQWNTSDERLRDLIKSTASTLTKRPPGVDPPSLVEQCAFRLRRACVDSQVAMEEVERALPRELRERFTFNVPL